jgi:hypothetical protein
MLSDSDTQKGVFFSYVKFRFRINNMKVEGGLFGKKGNSGKERRTKDDVGTSR